MKCRHCNAFNSPFRPYVRVIDGGRAYAQICAACGRILRLRPRIDSDPIPHPLYLSEAHVARLRFVQWRLSADCRAQRGDGPERNEAPPGTAA